MSTTFPTSALLQQLMGRQLRPSTWTKKTKKTSLAFIQLASGTFSTCISYHILPTVDLTFQFALFVEIFFLNQSCCVPSVIWGLNTPQKVVFFFWLSQFTLQLTMPKVQQECIPQAVLGMDVLCQAKSGHGKTAVFVLATLQQLEPVNGEVSVLVLCHTRELAFQIKNEYTRFAKYMPDVRVSTFYGGTPVTKDAEILRDKTKCPHIVVATPGRLNALARDKVLDAKNVKHFVLDECDKMLEQLGQSCEFGAHPSSRHHLCYTNYPILPSLSACRSIYTILRLDHVRHGRDAEHCKVRKAWEYSFYRGRYYFHSLRFPSLVYVLLLQFSRFRCILISSCRIFSFLLSRVSSSVLSNRDIVH